MKSCTILLLVFGASLAAASPPKTKATKKPGKDKSFSSLSLRQVIRPSTTDMPVVLAKGLEIYKNNCIVCHGPEGRGDGAAATAMPIKPRNYREEKFKYGSSPTKIVHTLYVGRSNLMPSFADAFKPKEMWAAAHLVWSWIPRKNREDDTSEALKTWQPPKSGSSQSQ